MPQSLSGFLLLMLSCILVHGAVPQDCFQSEIKKINLKVFPGLNDSNTFEYRYLHRKVSESPDIPTIIFVPGGPGGTSINMGFVSQVPTPGGFDFLGMALGLPRNSNIILTDPRGRGCNFDPEKLMPDTAFRTSYLASDILALIRHLKLKNYILIGSSYGSVLVTETAARANKGEAPDPAAVVLTGVMGKYDDSDQQEQAFQKEWTLVRKSLPDPIAELFPSDLSDFTSQVLPFSFSGELWLNYIKEKLTFGTVLTAGKPMLPTLANRLQILLSENEKEKQALAEEVSESKSQLDGLEDSPVFAQIACREIFSEEVECKKRNIPFDNPYDSAKWQISSTIYYVHGENDPNTPPAQALYHFLSHKNSNRVLITVPMAGHSAMIAINECKDFFWQSVLNGGKDLEKHLEICSANPKVIRP